ncbi:MAG: FAD-dependent thymidylate synthase [Acidimicrobiia bacterium]
MAYHVEPFGPDEEAVLRRFFTNTDRPVFALLNLPEVVKGALFARYSRSPKSVRRLFLDEFVADPETGIQAIAAALEDGDPLVDHRRAERLYQRVFFEYGDDSVAQLGGAHLACEQASNVLTKVLEWGRLAAYLEQSTRYVAYDIPLGDRYRYHIPPEIEASALLAGYGELMEALFAGYAALADDMQERFAARFPRGEEDSPAVWRATIRAKAFDTVRGLLPAATLSNVGIYGTGQAYEMALVRMHAHPLAEVRDYGEMMLEELRKVIPSFLTRVDLPDRGRRWSDYLAGTAATLERLAAELDEPSPQPGPASVTLTDWDPDAEAKIAAAALYAVSELPDARLLDIARGMTPDQRAKVVAALVGDRGNRRHKPGRPMERTAYRFDVTCDYGAFRDLQRHRMMTIEWQRYTTRLGFDVPPDLVDAGHEDRWRSLLDRAAESYEQVRAELGPDVAQYVVPFAAHVRFVMEMSPRQAFHLIELRSQPAGHPAYRWVAHEMHRQIADVAGHHLVADAMRFVETGGVELERLESERRAEERRRAVLGG